MKVGLIGTGAIGQQILAALSLREIEVVLLRRPNRPEPEGLPAGVEAVDSVEAFVARSPRVVIEASHQKAVPDLLPQIISTGIPVILCSTGALADMELRQRLVDAAALAGTEIIVPGGAVGGLDYLRSVSGLRDTRVTYTSRKAPAAWRSELTARGLSAEALREPVTLFEGNAAEAARLFPRNLNAAITLQLAAGDAEMRVRVVADPRAGGNTHEIEVVGPAGSARMEFVNAPLPDNPKTSALTALSVLRALDDYLLRRGLRVV